MRARFIQFCYAVFNSYWLVPSLMAFAAMLLSVVTTAIDLRLGPDWHGQVRWLSFNTEAAARAVLSTIAGSMVTVAGVTFSVTIAALAYATGQLGPRLLNNFMRDRGNQITLGTFIATFVYCLLVLRTVHGETSTPFAEAFMPHVGITVALALALASVGVLIYFIHHVPMSIHASQVIGQIGEELVARLSRLFAEDSGPRPDPQGDARADRDYPAEGGDPVRAHGQGYITHIDRDGLFRAACDHGATIRLMQLPGGFVARGDVLARVYGANAQAADKIARAFAFDRKRTHDQDVLFGVRQLVEIATRALSPGMNDPFTAMTCVDWLGNALLAVGDRRTPSPCRRTDDGVLRVIDGKTGFEDIASDGFDRLRPYLCTDRNSTLYTLSVIERVRAGLTDPERRGIMLRHGRNLAESAAEVLPHARDRASVAEAAAALDD